MALLLFAVGLAASSFTPQSFDLDGPWRLTQVQRKIDIPAKVPGVVQTDLIRSHIIPDPYLGQNEKSVQWVGDLPWTYSREFTLSSAYLRHAHILLHCEGIDTLASIFVNGRLLGTPNNMFRTWELDAKPLLRAGENSIRFEFQPVEPFLKAHEVQPAFPGKPVQSHGWGYVRKAPFQQGWDFSPKLITYGIWRKIGLIAWDQARLTDIAITQDHRPDGEVDLTVHAGADASRPVQVKTTVRLHGRKIAEITCDLTEDAKLHISKPQLWWPNDMGAHTLYDVNVELTDRSGHLVDQGARRIGLRTITWYPKTETSPLTLAVNGRRFFARGSNWVPTDSLLREDPAKEERLVKLATDAHMNLMRLWGGGFYESDAFLDACDARGLLVWFEFKFADATYPSFDPAWLSNVRSEAEDNVRRVRHHPSIAVYSGNNEVIGFIGKTTTPSGMSREDYNLLFHTTLRDVVQKLAPGAFYTPGSPEIGDDHYWDVWHGSAEFSSYKKLHGFMSEFGFQSFPVPVTIEAVTSPTDRTSVETPAMLEHQKNWRDGNALIVSTLSHGFQDPKDFDSTLWLSQIQQAYGILMGVEHWRRDWPRSSGSLVWQFDDPWPGISWSMVDYFARPKALYYALRRAYAPVALSGQADVSSGTAELWAVNDRDAPRRGRLDWELWSTSGERIRTGSLPVAIPAGTSSMNVAMLDLKDSIDKFGPKNLLLSARLAVQSEPDSATTLFFAPPKDLSLVQPEIATEVAADGNAYRVTLRSLRPALWCWLDLQGIDADYSNNFFSLFPGHLATIEVWPRKTMSLDEVKSGLRVRSLFDTYR